MITGLFVQPSDHWNTKPFHLEMQAPIIRYDYHICLLLLTCDNIKKSNHEFIWSPMVCIVWCGINISESKILKKIHRVFSAIFFFFLFLRTLTDTLFRFVHSHTSQPGFEVRYSLAVGFSTLLLFCCYSPAYSLFVTPLFPGFFLILPPVPFVSTG